MNKCVGIWADVPPVDQEEPIVVDAPAPHGARRPAAATQSARSRLSDWSSVTAVQSSSAAPYEPEVAYQRQRGPSTPERQERGLPGWGALIVLIGLAIVGGIIDTISGSQARSGFNDGIIIASVAAIMIVRRSGMFPIVIAPPIVYALGSGAMLYVRSGGLHNRRVLFDGAANWLVYGFPSIAAATAAVLIIAGIRLIIRR